MRSLGAYCRRKIALSTELSVSVAGSEVSFTLVSAVLQPWTISAGYQVESMPVPEQMENMQYNAYGQGGFGKDGFPGFTRIAKGFGKGDAGIVQVWAWLDLEAPCRVPCVKPHELSPTEALPSREHERDGVRAGLGWTDWSPLRGRGDQFISN